MDVIKSFEVRVREQRANDEQEVQLHWRSATFHFLYITTIARPARLDLLILLYSGCVLCPLRSSCYSNLFLYILLVYLVNTEPPITTSITACSQVEAADQAWLWMN
jgi:hypothetical protein